MTNDSKDLALLNKNILAALDADSKDALQKVVQQWSDSERECIKLDYQKFVQELIQKYDGRLKLQAAEIECELYKKYIVQYNDLATTLGEHRAMFLEGYAKQYELNEKNKGKPYYEILNKKLEKELKTFLKNQERIFAEGEEAIRCLTVEDMKNFAEDETHITELEQEVQKHIRETTEEWDAKREEKVKEVEKRLLNDTSQDAELITPFFTPKNEFAEQEDEIYIHAGEDLKIFKGLSSLSNTLSDLTGMPAYTLVKDEKKIKKDKFNKFIKNTILFRIIIDAVIGIFIGSLFSKIMKYETECVIFACKFGGMLGCVSVAISIGIWSNKFIDPGKSFLEDIFCTLGIEFVFLAPFAAMAGTLSAILSTLAVSALCNSIILIKTGILIGGIVVGMGEIIVANKSDALYCVFPMILLTFLSIFYAIFGNLVL